MCAGTLVHISRPQGKMSINNNKRFQLWSVVCLAMFACIRFYFGFPVLWLLYYTCSCPAFPLVFYSISLPWLTSYAVYLLAPACLYSRYGLQCMFMTWIYRYTCAYLCLPLGIRITTLRGVLSDSSGSSCPGFEAWSMWILPVADQSGAAEAWIPSRPSWALSFQTPCASLEFSFYKLMSPICIVHTCIPLCILAFAPIGDVISL